MSPELIHTLVVDLGAALSDEVGYLLEKTVREYEEQGYRYVRTETLWGNESTPLPRNIAIFRHKSQDL